MVEVQFPFLLIKTKKGLALMDRFGRIQFLRKMGSAFIVIMPFLGFTMIFLLLNAINGMLSSPSVSETIRELGLTANISIPGLNPYLPILYGWAALFLAMIVHEYSHGVQARANGMNVKSIGIVLFLILPLGAFAEVDEKELEKSELKSAGRVLSAGPVSNIIVAFASLFVFMLLICSLKPVANGILVTRLASNGTAYSMGMREGDIVVEVNNCPTPDWKSFVNVINNTYRSGGNITFKVLRNSLSNHTFTVKPDLNATGILGLVPLKDVLDNYSSALTRSPSGIATYLMIPTVPFPWVYENIPFSDMLQKYYTSTVFGENYHYLMNLFFWIWFLNLNLGIFNALPLYPMDGGIVFKLLCRSKLSNRMSIKTVDKMVYTVSLTMLGLIIGTIIIPYVVG